MNDATGATMNRHAGEPAHFFVTAPDGLKLHACAYGARRPGRRPVVCLPGLARTSLDFHALAMALAYDPDRARPVFALDSRGRGQSEYDSSSANYNIAVELADLIAVLTALEIEPAAFVGTSRGGILAMMLATARPGAVAGVVLNDIGPVIEPKGLVRIKRYVGRLPQPRSYAEAAEILRRLFDAQFPALSADGWLSFAQRTFAERDGTLVTRYDPKLATILDSVDLERSPPPMWREFEALAQVPVMVIRGENSDILSADTVKAMGARHRNIETLEVPAQGHAPLLEEDDVISRIAAFIARC